MIGGLPVRGHDVMGLVDDQPVRPAGPGAQVADAREQGHEERGAIAELEAEQVDDRVLAGLGQQLHALVDRRRTRPDCPTRPRLRPRRSPLPGR